MISITSARFERITFGPTCRNGDVKFSGTPVFLCLQLASSDA